MIWDFTIDRPKGGSSDRNMGNGVACHLSERNLCKYENSHSCWKIKLPIIGTEIVLPTNLPLEVLPDPLTNEAKQCVCYA